MLPLASSSFPMPKASAVSLPSITEGLPYMDSASEKFRPYANEYPLFAM